jgi:3-hydroxy-3-methylglutaryl CoA synthase
MVGVRGITGCGVYLPYRRLDLREVGAVAGGGGRNGWRTVASFDEDATTMAVEAARAALRSGGEVDVRSLWFTTVAPPYLDRTNANAIHAALRLDRTAPAYDVVGSVRSAFGSLRAAHASPGAALAVASDLRTGLAGGPDEAYFGDGAGAVIFADGPDRPDSSDGPDGSDGPVLAEVVGWHSVSDEFLDRWRTPGETRSKVWEERFGEMRYTDAGIEALEGAIKQAGADAAAVDRLLVTGTHGRAVKAVTGRSGLIADPVVDELSAQVGITGAAHPYVLLTAALERAVPDQLIALIALADGAEAILLRTTRAAGDQRGAPPVADQLASGGSITYGRYLAWRGLLPVEPPRRPEPARVSASASGRSAEWKFGLVGSSSEEGTVSMPPALGDLERRPMADTLGTVKTFTIDRLSYTPSPPLVFAVVDFDGGGRLPMELTDVDASDVSVGDRVEMVFRRLSSADGIHNYFWKARPVRGRSA